MTRRRRKRSHAERVLANIEAVLEKRATRDQEEYSIDGRSLKRTPLPDLVMLRDRYRREVAAENGETGITTLQFRFGD